MDEPYRPPLRRRWWEIWLPMWLTLPLTFLGFIFLSLPLFGLDGWFGWWTALGLAIALGIWARLRYRVDIQQAEQGLYLIRVEDRKHYSPTTRQ